MRTLPTPRIHLAEVSVMVADPSARRRHLLALAVGMVCAGLIGAGVYGLAAGSPDPAPSAPSPDTDAGTDPPPGSRRRSPSATAAPLYDELPALPHSSDPVLYARAVARTLLAWDTMSGLTPVDHARPVLADADPAGLETPGLAADVATYLPTVKVWQQLRGYATSQWVTIDAAFVPDSWDDIATSAAQQLHDGTVAVTIEATRHRTGVWFDEPAAADHPTAFTVFVACPPAFLRCHTLRLSQLDTPLP